MVKKIKKTKRKKKRARGWRPPGWWVPFDAEGQAAIYVHKHGDTDDHSNCGPVVMCCNRAVAPYHALAPDLVTRVDDYRWQGGDHICSWLEAGVQAIYVVLCDPDDPHAVYQFGLPADEARALLLGRVGHDAYRLPQCRHEAPVVDTEASEG